MSEKVHEALQSWASEAYEGDDSSNDTGADTADTSINQHGFVVQAGQAVASLDIRSDSDGHEVEVYSVDLLPSASPTIVKLLQLQQEQYKQGENGQKESRTGIEIENPQIVNVKDSSDFAFLADLRTSAADEGDVASFLYLCEGLADAQERKELVGSQAGVGKVSEKFCKAVLEWRSNLASGCLEGHKYIHFVLEEGGGVLDSRNQNKRDRDGPGTEDEEAGGFKRRLSKAEKKKLANSKGKGKDKDKDKDNSKGAAESNSSSKGIKGGNGTSDAVSEGGVLSQSGAGRSGGREGPPSVISLRYEHDDDGELLCHWVTTAEICASYSQHLG